MSCIHYEKSKIFMMTSNFEGFGMTLTEALQNACVPFVFNTFSSLGVLENLDSKISKDKSFESSKFYEQALALGKIENKQYALPMEIDPTLLFVNKTLMEKEGIKIEVKDEMLEEIEILVYDKKYVLNQILKIKF